MCRGRCRRKPQLAKTKVHTLSEMSEDQSQGCERPYRIHLGSDVITVPGVRTSVMS